MQNRVSIWRETKKGETPKEKETPWRVPPEITVFNELAYNQKKIVS
jgi:hypothetical protein